MKNLFQSVGFEHKNFKILAIFRVWISHSNGYKTNFLASLINKLIPNFLKNTFTLLRKSDNYFREIKMIYILGGGPTGVSVAHELDKVSDEEFILIEKGEKLAD